MAGKDPKIQQDFALGLQNIMSKVDTLVSHIDTVFSSMEDKSKRMTKNIKQQTDEYQKGGEQLGAIRDLNSSLIKDLEDQAKNAKVKNLAMKTGVDVQVIELQLAKQQAIASAQAVGASKELLQKIRSQYDQSIIHTKEMIHQAKLRKEEEEAAEKINKIEEFRNESLKEIGINTNVIKDIMNGGIARTIALTAIAAKLGDTFSEAYKELKAEGLSSTQAAHESMTSFTDSMSTGFLTSAKSIREARKSISDMGGTLHEAEAAGKDVANLVSVYGGSEAAAGKMYGTMTKVAGMNKEAALKAVEFGSALSVAAGVPADTVTKAVSENTEAAALAGPKYAKSFAMAAVNAKKLGVEMSAITGMQKSLLDFESSINNQTEASVLLGKEINLDKAREFALSGDLAGMQQEILKNVGSAAEFDKMNVLQKEALAKSMGVSVSDMAKMVHGQGELTELGKEAAEAEKAKAGTMDRIKNAAMENMGAILGAVPGLVMQTAQLLAQFSMMKSMKALSGTPGKGGLLGTLTGGLLGKTELPKPELPKAEVPGKAGGLGAGASAGGGMKGLASGLKSMAGGKVTQGIGNLALFGLAAIPAVASLPFLITVSMLGIPAGLGLTGLSEGLKGTGMGAALVSKGIANLALYGLASIVALLGLPFMIGVALTGYLAGLGMVGLSTGLKAMAKVPLQGILVLGLLGLALIPAAVAFMMLKDVPVENMIAFSIALPLLGLAAAGLGMISPLVALGAIALGALGVGMIAVAGGLMVLQAAEGGIAIFESLTAVAQNVTGLGGVAMAMVGIAGGLGVMAYTGLAAMPVILALIALAAVAPALTGLGASLGGMFGGGGGDKEDKMDTLIAKVDTLISVASKGGVINMDGKKVGDIIRTSINSSGVR